MRYLRCASVVLAAIFLHITPAQASTVNFADDFEGAVLDPF
jgi:hypothetical protein